jgi:hypothetical protein
MALPYNVSSLKTPVQCRTVMARAKEQGLDEVYKAVFQRYCDLVGQSVEDPEDPLVRGFFETLAAYEQLLTERNGKTTKASRTRQKIDNKGVHQSLIEWTRGAKETEGFELLVEQGLPEFTGEYLVARYAGRFPEDVVAKAHERLTKYEIPLPQPIE